MAHIPKCLQENPLNDYLMRHGLQGVNQGKVRDTFRVDDDRLLPVATDRLSAFDFVLPVLVPKKGEVLTAMTHFWLTKVLNEFPNHLMPSSHVGYNEAYDLREDFLHDLPIERCLVVKDLRGQLFPFEMIYRHHIGGSVFKSYQKTGIAGGHKLPPNLPKWSKLDAPIFTPSTKEEVGHDINVDAAFFFSEMAKRGLDKEARKTEAMLSLAYFTVYAYAEERGILILDTKYEAAPNMIADEFTTPDSSRFALKTDWEQAMAEGRDPKFLDKQPVRDYLAQIETPFKDSEGNQIIGINNLSPQNIEHLAFVDSLEIPEKVISDTTERYLSIPKMLIGQSLEDYQKKEMGV